MCNLKLTCCRFSTGNVSGGVEMFSTGNVSGGVESFVNDVNDIGVVESLFCFFLHFNIYL
jgi:hypothetical protein